MTEDKICPRNTPNTRKRLPANHPPSPWKGYAVASANRREKISGKRKSFALISVIRGQSLLWSLRAHGFVNTMASRSSARHLPSPNSESLRLFRFTSNVGETRRRANFWECTSPAPAGVSDPGYNGARARCFDSDYDVDLPNGRLLRFSVDLDFSQSRRALAPFGIFFARFRISRMGTSGDHIFCAPCDVSLHAAKLRRSQIQPLTRVA